jgi:hypothetical protein
MASKKGKGGKGKKKKVKAAKPRKFNLDLFGNLINKYLFKDDKINAN